MRSRIRRVVVLAGLAGLLAVIGAFAWLGIDGVWGGLSAWTRRPGHSPPPPGPVAVVDRTSVDLGSIESPEQFHHTFAVRNDGIADLVLTLGPRTCHCLEAEIPASPIPPGGTAAVRVFPSEAARKDKMPPGAAINRAIPVATNDPDHEMLQLVLSAKVHARLAASPENVTLNVLALDAADEAKRSSKTLVYSQRWDRFELTQTGRSLSGLCCRIEPATPQELAGVEGRSGYRVSLTLPPDVKDGRIQEWIDFSAAPPRPAAAEPLRVKIEGMVSGRVAFSGPQALDSARVGLGAVRRGESRRAELVMKVNDPRRVLAISAVETTPEFMRARVTPLGKAAESKGLYRLSIEVPGSAPECAFTGDNPAVVRLKTDHPRLPVIELKVDVVVFAGGGSSREVVSRVR